MVATASSENSSLCVRSETMTGRTVCSKWARTGPWGSRLEWSSGSTRQCTLFEDPLTPVGGPEDRLGEGVVGHRIVARPAVPRDTQDALGPIWIGENHRGIET